jgi:NTE family protein
MSIFEGLPPEDLARVVESLECRVYEAGQTVVAEGDRTKEVFIAQSGSADVVIAGEDGVDRLVGRIVPGGTVGEISLLTGQPAVATVRAGADFEAIVLAEGDFARLAESFPQVYRNLGAILAERLARTDRLAIGGREGRLTQLEDAGAPPLLGYALACSIAWHTRERTLFLVLSESPHQDLLDLATTSGEQPWRSARALDELGADLMIAPKAEAFEPRALPGTLEALFHVFDHILVQCDGESAPKLATARPVRLAASDGPVASAVGDPLTVCGWSGATTRRRPDLDGVVEVTELSSEEQRQLGTGVLALGSPAGRELGWAARELTGLKVGLALGAGSIRGYAHVGVIEVLRSAGLQFDYLAGTSVGAAVAALLAWGNDPAEIADHLDAFAPNLFKLKIPFTSMLSDRGMRAYLRSQGPDVEFKDLAVPLALVAADMLTSRELVLRRGIVWQAVLASISIPGIYPAQRIGPYVCVDGGVLNPFPVNVAAEMGAGTVIGVNLGSGAPLPEHEVDVAEASGRPPAMLGVLLHSIEMMQRGIDAKPTDATVITIGPKLDPAGVGLRNMEDGRRYIEDGAAAAEAALARVSAALPWLR